MSQIRTGLRRFLEFPVIYDLSQRLAGADAAKRRLVEEFLRPFSGARLLDVGCATGQMLEYLPADIEYIGIDMNPKYIESAQAMYGSRGAFVCSLVEDVDTIAKELGLFDVILIRGLLHHVDDGVADRLFEFCHSVLKPAGYIITSDPVYAQGQSRFARFVMWKDRGKCIRTYDGYLALPSPYFPSIETSVVSNMLRLPYTHLIMRISNA